MLTLPQGMLSIKESTAVEPLAWPKEIVHQMITEKNWLEKPNDFLFVARLEIQLLV